MRIQFCGVIEGSVTRRPGESKAEALRRAEAAIQRVLDGGARRYVRDAGDKDRGPIVGLEPAEGGWEE